jgi:hypothetical protein
MTYPTLVALTLPVATVVATWTLHRIGVRPVAWYRSVRAARRGEARLAAAIHGYGADGWRAQDPSALWFRGVER